MGVGNLTEQPVYPDENEVLNHDPLLIQRQTNRELSADLVTQRSSDRVSTTNTSNLSIVQDYTYW